jgi:parallel beta-helix repeat protein
MTRILAAALSLLVVQAVRSEAATLLVPDDFETIQAAVDAAASGDTVMITVGGSITGAVVISDKSLTLVGPPGPPRFTIQVAGLRGKGILVRQRTADITVALRHLNVELTGVGLVAQKVANLEVEDVHILGCRIGAILKGTTVSVVDSRIAGSIKGGLKLIAAGPLVQGNDFSNNGRDGARITNRAVGEISAVAGILDNVFSGNGRAGLELSDKEGVVLSNNVANDNGGSGFSVKTTRMEPDLDGNQAHNNAEFGIRLRGEIGSLTEASLIADGNAATGNGVADFFLQ